MMDTMLIQLTNSKALGLIQELEQLHLIKVLKKDVAPSGKKLSEKYAGKLPSELATEMLNYLDQSRKEWSSRDI